LHRNRAFVLPEPDKYDMNMRQLKWQAMGREVKEAMSDQKNTVTQTACMSQY
jgi:hypothetical protein